MPRTQSMSKLITYYRFIENWHKWAVESLIDAFPSFPVQLLHGVNGDLSHTMLPRFDDDNMGNLLLLNN